MSDAFFDADRDAGLYPPKGWGWYSDAARKQKIKKLLAAGNREPWLLEQAKLHNIPCENSR